MSTSVVKVTGASKRFVIRKDKSLKERLVNLGRSNQHKDDFWALRDVDLDITSGSTVGLIGPNGSGKSTLLKLIGGILQPTTGTVEHRGRLAALLELGAGFHPDLTGRENVFLNASILGLSQKQTEKFFDPIVDFSGIEQFIDTQVKFYSSGMYVRLAFAVAVHVDPDVLLVDEVLAVGDEPFQRKCMDRIREFQKDGRTIILVTHALDQVAELCDRAIVLEKGVVQVDGDPLQALRHLRADFELTRQDEIERQRSVAVAAAAAQAVDSSAAADMTPGPDGDLPVPVISSGATAGARMLSVTLTDPDGNALVSIGPGEALDVTVTAEVDGVIDDAVIGIGIDSALGQVVFGTNTKLMNIELPPLSGSSTFTFRLPELWLGEGQYFVHTAIARDGGVELHRLVNAASLAVYARGDCIGFVNARTELIVAESDLVRPAASAP
ncbi:ABC-2 type transport system ATP-binding protein [Nakamurella panacisegetis]|uniref:ABC-2 type transport system ATP-binding protein n=1 Tax=Nakamurella panacisegetis TaxID=1090615 RepID=A0A1H0PHM4_9ACTN|nr:ABC transporter ATP-binding protein [Nakamurella panacisegetis]SDP04494.1 ABC-2 type transport system ATP-binding protein [Nakamurella panacisegetis]